MGESRGRWQHPRVLAVGILVAIVLAASGFAGGYFLRSADQLALRNSERDVVVTAEVQVRAAERTVLGIFTIIVLLRDSVRELYAASRASS